MPWSAKTMTRLSVLGSCLFTAGLGASYFVFRSELALAQAADSLVDVAGALVLAYAVGVAQTPRDAKHPMGHSRAEPLGALAVAGLALVLAFEVAQSAVLALSGEARVQLSEVLLALFVAKVLFKAIILAASRGSESPAVRALAVDARNDVLVGVVAVAGYFAARFGAAAIDAWLSVPLAAYIGWSGVALARENTALLMGVAPSAERQTELLRLASEQPGVLDAHGLQAHYLGSELSVYVHVTVAEELTVREGHDLGEAVRVRLEQEADVVHCSVHVDPAEPPTDGSPAVASSSAGPAA